MRTRTPAQTLQMLQQWLWLGREVDSQAEHQMLWATVEESKRDGSLPDRPQIVRDFRNARGQAVRGRGRKRRQAEAELEEAEAEG